MGRVCYGPRCPGTFILYTLTIHFGLIVGRACKRKIEEIKYCRYSIYGEKICQNLHQRRNVKLHMCSETLNGKNFQKNMCYIAMA